MLQTGALPVKFETLDRTDISATLGKDSLEEAWKAAIAGLILVAIFLLVFYRFLGLVAVAGLAIYAAFLYATILLFNVTLTLPGFAGLVLTFGVAADANIVIFERIKEEVRAGRSVRAAIAQGYRKGFATIVDANVVTAITAMVLFVVATASVRGFALMLLIGTALSMLTAVLATRAILALLGGLRLDRQPALHGHDREGHPPLAAVGLHRPATDLVRDLRNGLSRCRSSLSESWASTSGIDFKGGTQITFRTPEPTSLEEVRREAGAIGQADAVIQGRGDSTDGRYTNFQIRTESLTTAEQNELQQGLASAVEATAFGAKNVSESFGRQIANNALLRDRREPAPDRRLHLDPLPVEVLGRRARRARARPHHHGRDLRAHRARGVDGHRRGDPDRSSGTRSTTRSSSSTACARTFRSCGARRCASSGTSRCGRCSRARSRRRSSRYSRSPRSTSSAATR